MSKNPYFKSNKPPIDSRLVLPSALPYDLQMTIMFNSHNGNTELRLASLNAATKEITLLQIAGILMEHATSVLRQLCTGKDIQVIKLDVEEGKGEQANGEQSKA